jgi:hypothetical protein
MVGNATSDQVPARDRQERLRRAGTSRRQIPSAMIRKIRGIIFAIVAGHNPGRPRSTAVIRQISMASGAVSAGSALPGRATNGPQATNIHGY